MAYAFDDNKSKNEIYNKEDLQKIFKQYSLISTVSDSISADSTTTFSVSLEDILEEGYVPIAVTQIKPYYASGNFKYYTNICALN